ncbi:MAG TPA: glycosyltransferase family 2 protein [Caulobacteraceae bacterium]
MAQSDFSPIEISAMVPCLNEAENVARLVEAILIQFRLANVSAWEIVFIDNRSTDGTIDIIKRLCAEEPRIRLIVNNRNFGQIRSPVHGIYQTRGAGVIGISADFQDPPELIGEMIGKWRAGTRIVLAVRQSEDMSPAMRLGRALFYGFMARFADYPVIPGATGFGLFDREVIECLRHWRDPEPFFRGMLVESGYSLETIPYHRPPRARGSSKNNFWTLVSFGLSSIAACSRGLLRAPLYLSAIVFAIAALTLLTGATLSILRQPAGAIWLSAALELGFGLIFLFLGLIGEQVRLISEMARGTPLVTEKERVNFPPA